VARLLCDVLRTSDTVVRSGGEEFLVLMPHTDAHAAVACCERIRTTVREAEWENVAGGLVVTTSIGVSSAEDPSDLQALVRLADHRLYEAKHGGRDRVVAESA
jgi:diguanylate cyclase (GGDEF)-like protein